MEKDKRDEIEQAIIDGGKIRELLEIRKMTQADLHRKTGLSTGMISEYISGKRKGMTIETLKRLADGLGIHPAYLIEGTTIGPADILPHLTDEEREFVLDKKSLPWIKVSQDAELAGITPEKIRQIIDLILSE